MISIEQLDIRYVRTYLQPAVCLVHDGEEDGTTPKEDTYAFDNDDVVGGGRKEEIILTIYSHILQCLAVEFVNSQFVLFRRCT